MLTILSRRAAFVRSGDTTGVIYTENTRPHLEGQALQERIDAILTQTRQKYARPKHEVEAELAQPFQSTQSPDTAVPGIQPTIVRWEDVEP